MTYGSLEDLFVITPIVREACFWILVAPLEEWASVSEEESVKEARGWESVGESEKAVAAREMARARAVAVLAVGATDL